MRTEEELVKAMISSIKKIIGIIKSEISEIDGKGNSNKQTEKDPVDEDIRTNILHTQKSYLDFYRKIANFLYLKMENNTPDEEFFFYIPLVRTLIEIYAYLLYFCFQDKNMQMKLASVNTLNTIAKLDTENTSQEIKAEYTQNYIRFKDFFDREKMIVPRDADKNTQTWLKGSGYAYPPSLEQMLREDWVKDSSPQINRANPNASKNIYKIYRHLSNYVHGNILSKEHHGNEKMWVISEVILLSTRIAELVSVKILDNSKRKEIESCIKEVAKSANDFQQMWRARVIKGP